jgi:hypothetical protein
MNYSDVCILQHNIHPHISWMNIHILLLKSKLECASTVWISITRTLTNTATHTAEACVPFLKHITVIALE